MLDNAVSKCNVLCVGNLCSALSVLAIYRPRGRPTPRAEGSLAAAT